MTDSSRQTPTIPGSSASAVRVQEYDLTVNCWPIRDSLLCRVSTVAVFFLTAGSVWWTGQVVIPLVMGGLLLVCLLRLWLPARYEIGPTGITRTLLGRRRHLPWYLVESVEHCEDGIRVYPRTGGGLSALHAMHIYAAAEASQLHELAEKYRTLRPSG